MKTNFSGTGVALITPFRKQGTIEFGTLENIIELLIEAKVDYIVALGTTSEAATMSEQERNALIDNILEIVAGRLPIVLGIGGNNTLDIVDKIKHTNFDGISGILSVSPYYNKPQQRGIYLHYKSISEVSPVPIIMYNVPGRTASNITAETTLQIAEDCSNIVATKEASGNMGQVMEILRNKPKSFSVLSGDDALTMPMMSVGASGVISVVANAFPAEMSKMVNHCLKGNFQDALPIHYGLLPIMNALFEEGNPAGVKAAMEIKGIISNNLRLPLTKVSKPLYNKISNLIANFEQNK
ncbi:MAG: 4-hydroxy-tetrahydrodipicolinate synthase [Bacteroidales bacterium]|jgi:4-hydroxy-tetrahydrodipicolinate synthase|nr:4-hydroxy-tetrahydrodipicolinate synthase [Bacteroidales bacterium]